MTTNPLIDPPSWPLAEFCPPHEFVKNWESRYKEVGHKPEAVLQHVAEQASQWGADKELEACCEWLEERAVLNGSTALRTARRPKPPTLKEQALAILDDCSDRLDGSHENIIRRALEALPQ
jgi:hypothetical protein